jgi:hypothetical protein
VGKEEGGMIRVGIEEGVIHHVVPLLTDTFLPQEGVDHHMVLLPMDTFPPQGGVIQVVAIQVMLVVARQTTPATTEVAARTNATTTVTATTTPTI